MYTRPCGAWGFPEVSNPAGPSQTALTAQTCSLGPWDKPSDPEAEALRAGKSCSVRLQNLRFCGVPVFCGKRAKQTSAARGSGEVSREEFFHRRMLGHCSVPDLDWKLETRHKVPLTASRLQHCKSPIPDVHSRIDLSAVV